MEDVLPTPKLELVDTVATAVTRADMSESLVKPAKKADEDRKFALAIVYYRALVVARGPTSPEAVRLAELWALAGQPTAAVRVYDDIIAAATDLATYRAMKKARDKQAKVGTAFSKEVDLPSLDKEGKAIFEKGVAAFKKKNYGDALVYYTMGFALAPDLPGFLRKLGDAYEKLGAKDKRLEFYLRYLRARPFGENADAIRTELAKEKGVLGDLTVTANLPCDSGIQIEQQLVPTKLIKKAFKIAPGTYDGLCYSAKYEFGMWAQATVVADGSATMSFQWALVENKLVKPLGRIQIEDPNDPGVMRDLGVSAPVVGVQVPPDGRSLKYVAKDDTGEKVKEDFLKLEAGQRYEIKW